MENSLDINHSEFRLNDVTGNLDLIRWGMFEGSDKIMKFAAFKISLIEASLSSQSGVDFVAQSNDIIKGEESQAGAKHQAYEWIGDSFESVNPDNQRWFKFS